MGPHPWRRNYSNARDANHHTREYYLWRWPNSPYRNLKLKRCVVQPFLYSFVSNY